jgi:hypothetical protein
MPVQVCPTDEARLRPRLPLSWDIEEEDAAHRRLRMTVHLPFGVVNHVTLKVASANVSASERQTKG